MQSFQGMYTRRRSGYHATNALVVGLTDWFNRGMGGRGVAWSMGRISCRGEAWPIGRHGVESGPAAPHWVMWRGHNGCICGSCVPDGCSMSGHFSFAPLGCEADLLGLHGHRQPRDLQMPGINHDASDVGVYARLLRNRVAPATGVAPMLYIHPRGWSLDGVLLYADLSWWCRVGLDRLYTLVKKQRCIRERGAAWVLRLWVQDRGLQASHPERGSVHHPCWRGEVGTFLVWRR